MFDVCQVLGCHKDDINAYQMVCLYLCFNRVYLLVYVDDILVAAKNLTDISHGTASLALKTQLACMSCVARYMRQLPSFAPYLE